jgi:hypothetical protein
MLAGALYTPATDDLSTLTMRLYWDGIVHLLTGAMGTWKMTAEAGGVGMIEWTFTGNYNTPGNVSFPVLLSQNVIPPLVENLDLVWPHQAGFSLLYSGSFNIDWGNQIAVRRDTNSAQGMHSVYVAGRNPTGSMTPEVSAGLSTSFASRWEGGNTGALSAEFGNANGNRVIFSSTAAQITSIAYGDRDNIRTYDIGLGFRRLAGNDEMTVLFP